jgi:hypothetical protein
MYLCFVKLSLKISLCFTCPSPFEVHLRTPEDVYCEDRYAHHRPHLFYQELFHCISCISQSLFMSLFTSVEPQRGQHLDTLCLSMFKARFRSLVLHIIVVIMSDICSEHIFIVSDIRSQHILVVIHSDCVWLLLLRTEEFNSLLLSNVEEYTSLKKKLLHHVVRTQLHIDRHDISLLPNLQM